MNACSFGRIRTLFSPFIFSANNCCDILIKIQRIITITLAHRQKYKESILKNMLSVFPPSSLCYIYINSFVIVTCKASCHCRISKIFSILVIFPCCRTEHRKYDERWRFKMFLLFVFRNYTENYGIFSESWICVLNRLRKKQNVRLKKKWN